MQFIAKSLVCVMDGALSPFNVASMSATAILLLLKCSQSLSLADAIAANACQESEKRKVRQDLVEDPQAKDVDQIKRMVLWLKVGAAVVAVALCGLASTTVLIHCRILELRFVVDF